MATITSLRVQHIRSHRDYTISLSPNATLVTGMNGAGKTSLIEALYIALQGSSFKSGDGDVLMKDKPWYRIDVAFSDETARTVKFEAAKQSGKKQFLLDEKVSYRLAPAHKYPVVLFEPDDLRLLHSSPARRRLFIDRFISQLDPQYALSLRRYERALKQRNALLKSGAYSDDSLFAWNISLSEYGAYIIEKRTEWILRLNEKITNVYSSIAQENDSIIMQPSHAVANNAQQQLLAELHANSKKDALLGYTSTGPHRHDIMFTFNDQPALSVASRGEVRTIILALKFLEVAILEEKHNKKPIILLDDVFGELDEVRQQAVVAQFASYQTIVASVGEVPIAGTTIRLQT